MCLHLTDTDQTADSTMNSVCCCVDWRVCTNLTVDSSRSGNVILVSTIGLTAFQRQMHYRLMCVFVNRLQYIACFFDQMMVIIV